LIWRNLRTGDNIVWFMQEGTPTSSKPFGVVVPDSGWIIEGTGDFNGDARTDLVWRNYRTGENAIWFLDSNYEFSSSAFFLRITNLNWKLQGVGDFDGDGHTDDLVWRHSVTGENLIWFMDGSTPQGSAIIPVDVPNQQWQIGGVGDFDGDGLEDDIVWRHYGTGNNRVWLMDGSTPQGSLAISLSLANANWRIEGVGDFDRDLKRDDLLWRNLVSGETAIWNTEAGAVVGGGRVEPDVAGPYWRVVA
jgi:hypothetical protein